MFKPSVLIWASPNQNPFVIHHIILVWASPNLNPLMLSNGFK